MKKLVSAKLALLAIVVATACKLGADATPGNAAAASGGGKKGDGDKGGAAEGKKVKLPNLKKVLGDAEGKLGSGMSSIGYGGSPAVEPQGEDKTLAPYFYVAGGDPETDRLPLKETSAEVKIAGVIARALVKQTFSNKGSKPIEAVYVFPASTRAAVHGMRMKIGERTIEAKIEERDEAKQQYEAAKNEGKHASLLEQQRANVFTMNVANIMPGDVIKVELDYSELLVPEDAVYEFVYPTVVGPRYGGGADPVKDSWISNPYLAEGEKEPYAFGIEVDIETGIPLKDVSSPSHKVAVSYASKSSAKVTLDQSGGGNKDFILRYRLAGDAIESGVLTYAGADENFFVVMMEPPKSPKLSQIPPREYIFLLDVSGSMYGFPLDTTKSLMKKLLTGLRATDYFNVVTFAGSAATMHPKSVTATKEHVDAALGKIEQLQGGGGTELMDGLKRAYSIPRVDDTGVSRTVVVATDGYVGVEAKSFSYIRNNLDDANVFAFGIGSGVNRALIEGMARAGMGEPFVVLKPETAPGEAARFQKYIESPVLTDIKVTFDGFKAEEVLPEKIPDLMAERPIVLIGKYKGEASGKVTVKGVSGDGAFEKSMDLGGAADKGASKPLRVLWARKWAELLDDQRALLPEDKELREAITSLGLGYNLLTSFTSFVAIDSEVVNKGGKQESVAQPLPLPEGVSNYAVGGSAGPMGGKAGGYAMAAQAMPSAAPPAKMMEKAKKASESKADSAADKPGDEEQGSAPSFTFTFSTDPVGAKLALTKKKEIEAALRGLLEKKRAQGAIPAGAGFSLTVTIDVASDGSVKAVGVAGDPGYGLKKAVEKKLGAVAGLSGVTRLTVTIACSF